MEAQLRLSLPCIPKLLVIAPSPLALTLTLSPGEEGRGEGELYANSPSSVALNKCRRGGREADRGLRSHHQLRDALDCKKSLIFELEPGARSGQ